MFSSSSFLRYALECLRGKGREDVRAVSVDRAIRSGRPGRAFFAIGFVFDSNEFGCRPCKVKRYRVSLVGLREKREIFTTTKTHTRSTLFTTDITTTGTKLRRPFRSRFRHHGRFLLLRGEQKQRRQVGRDDVVRLLVEPEEVHSRDEDGFRRLEETARQSRSDCVFERQHQVNEPPRFNKYYSSIKLYTFLRIIGGSPNSCLLLSSELFADRSIEEKSRHEHKIQQKLSSL